MSTLKWSSPIKILGIGLLLAAGGCVAGVPLTGGGIFGLPLPSPEQLRRQAEQPRFLGKSGDLLVVAKPLIPPDLFDNPAQLFALDPNKAFSPTYRVSQIDLATGEITVLDEAAPERDLYSRQWLAGAGQPDGRWKVSVSLNRPPVVVEDRTTGETKEYLSELPDTTILEIAKLQDGRLVVQVSRLTGGGITVIVVIDLETGEQMVIDRVEAFTPESVALKGDLLAFRAVPPFDPQTQPLTDFTKLESIDVVDLSTGERRTVVDELDEFADHRLWFAGDDVVWFTRTDNTLRVQSANVNTGEQTVVAELDALRGGTDSTALAGINSMAVMFQNTTALDVVRPGLGSGGVPQTISYVVTPLAGEPVTILEFTVENPEFFQTEIRGLSEHFAYVFDPRDESILVYNLETGETSRVFPFDEG